MKIFQSKWVFFISILTLTAPWVLPAKAIALDKAWCQKIIQKTSDSKNEIGFYDIATFPECASGSEWYYLHAFAQNFCPYKYPIEPIINSLDALPPEKKQLCSDLVFGTSHLVDGQYVTDTEDCHSRVIKELSKAFDIFFKCTNNGSCRKCTELGYGNTSYLDYFQTICENLPSQLSPELLAQSTYIRYNCTPQICGDGILTYPEQCEPPNTSTCYSNCMGKGGIKNKPGKGNPINSGFPNSSGSELDLTR